MVSPSADNNGGARRRASTHPRPAQAKPPANPKAARPFPWHAIAYGVVVVALCWTAKLDFQSRYANAILAATSAGAPDPNGKIDTAARQATADGNALLLFRGFSPDKGRDTHLISKAYFRGNYAAYPQRLFACDDAVAFDPNQIVAGQFAPTDTWLAEHNIHCILRVALDPAGNFVFAVHRL